MYVDPNYTMDMVLLNNQGKSNYNGSQYVHVTMVLSWSLANNTDLGTSVGECFENIILAVEHIVFPTMAEIAQELSVDATLQQF